MSRSTSFVAEYVLVVEHREKAPSATEERADTRTGSSLGGATIGLLLTAKMSALSELG